MIRMRERIDPDSCWNKANDGEMVFVLLSRDRAAPWAVRVWCIVRVLIRKNRWRDAQIQEAWKSARVMRSQRLLKDALDRNSTPSP